MAKKIKNVTPLGGNKYLLRISLGFDDYGNRIQPSKVIECAKSELETELARFRIYATDHIDEFIKQETFAAPKTLGELYNLWQTRNNEKKLDNSTIKFYTRYYDCFIVDKAKIKLTVLNERHIDDMLSAPQTARDKYGLWQTLNAMLNYGRKKRWIKENPCNFTEAPTYEAPERPVLPLSDLKRIPELISSELLKYQALFYFITLCTLRKEEIVALSWPGINFDNDYFDISNGSEYVKGEGTKIKKTKTKKSERKMYLPKILKEILLKLRDEQEIMKEKMGDLWQGEDWIFIQRNGKLMDMNTPNHWWQKFRTKHNIAPIAFYDLRHTAATYMLYNDGKLSTVSRALGHSNIGTTLNVYTHALDDTKEGVIHIMENLLFENDIDDKN